MDNVYSTTPLGDDPLLSAESNAVPYPGTALYDNERLMARIAELERDNQSLHDRVRQGPTATPNPLYAPPPYYCDCKLP